LNFLTDFSKRNLRAEHFSLAGDFRTMFGSILWWGRDWGETNFDLTTFPLWHFVTRTQTATNHPTGLDLVFRLSEI
jgi:hypothetical protein